MKRVGVFLILAMALIVPGSAMAQNMGDSSYYFVTYYSNNISGAPDATLRLINDGDSGDLGAWIFVFDDSQEMQACGACAISADGLLSEDVKTELTNNTLTGKVPSRGVIKLVSYDGDPGIHGWATHIERATPTSGAYSTTEAPLADSNLSGGEYTLLLDLCEYLLNLGSGQGTITCTPEDHEF